MTCDFETALAQSSFENDVYITINQMWSVNLIITQWATGTSA
jgi:hypothetical protein